MQNQCHCIRNIFIGEDKVAHSFQIPFLNVAFHLLLIPFTDRGYAIIE
jgi:hypothetical protein